jgi:hypothetical protein
VRTLFGSWAKVSNNPKGEAELVRVGSCSTARDGPAVEFVVDCVEKDCVFRASTKMLAVEVLEAIGSVEDEGSGTFASACVFDGTTL